jgi:hypothetical protein
MPNAPTTEVTRVAHVCLGIYKAGLELVLSNQGAEREAYIRELKDVLLRYLEPLIRDRTLTPANLTGEPAEFTAPTP